MLKIFDLKSLPIEIVDEKHVKENGKEKHYEYTFEFYNSKEFNNLLKYYDEQNQKKLEKLQKVNPEATKEDVPDWIHTENFVIGNCNLKDRLNNDYVLNWEKEHEDDENLTVLKMDILELEDKEDDYEQFDSYFRVTAPSEVNTYGYVRVGKYEYIRIEEGSEAIVLVKDGKFGRFFKRFGRFIGLTIILSVLIGGAVYFQKEGYSIQGIVNRIINGQQQEDNSDKTVVDGQKWDGELEKGEDSQDTAMEYIDVAGYMNLYCSEANPNIRLINMGTALQCYEEFVISLDGVEIYRTGLIRPREEVTWNAYETLTGLNLEKGTYWLNFHINNFEINEDSSVGGALNGVDMKVDITLR